MSSKEKNVENSVWTNMKTKYNRNVEEENLWRKKEHTKNCMNYLTS